MEVIVKTEHRGVCKGAVVDVVKELKNEYVGYWHPPGVCATMSCKVMKKHCEPYVPKENAMMDLIDGLREHHVLKEMIDGEYYYGKHRCTHYAQWNAKDNVFNYWKWEIFGPCWDRCNHFEDDDHFALFVPIAVATKEQFNATGKPKNRENESNA